MTFRGRLRVFFAMIVVVPMLAIGAALFSITADSERGKADAGLATALDVTSSLYADGRARARADLREGAREAQLARGLRSRDRAGIEASLERLLERRPGLVSATVLSPSGDLVARAGVTSGVAPAAVELSGPEGRPLGTLVLSATEARQLVAAAQRRTGAGAAVLRAGRPVASTEPAVRTVPRDPGDFEAGGDSYRGLSAGAPAPSGLAEQIAVFRRADDVNSAITQGRLLVAGILLAFLLLALASSTFVGHALQGQISHFLAAARRLGSGQFDQPVETAGDDEFAQLGSEFNSMSVQLKAQLDEVERQRQELAGSIRRVGQAFATGLDRQGVFELTVQTAVEACRAECGRGLPLDARMLPAVMAGESDAGLRDALEHAERHAVLPNANTGSELLGEDTAAAGTPQARRPVARTHEGLHSLAMPLRATLGRDTHAQYVAVLSVARRGEPFGDEEAELLSYLGNQAVVSIENADLHETVRRQAITDELTGLANTREMHAALDRELERGRRHDTTIGFVLLDVDNFKKVNDTYGHQQGDEVLARVAGVLRECSRDIDEPARYGGEELAVVLPQTDIEGAARFAERVRSAIEQLRIPLLGQSGDMGVTVSLGVASYPGGASDEAELIAAADAALYLAKRGGKNRVEVAEGAVLQG